MMMLRRVLSVLAFTLISISVFSQGYNVGIRAGLGQTKFSSPTEEGESFGLTGGFHFGINFQWNFNDFIGVRSEVLYNQMGSSYELQSDKGFYVFEPELSSFGNITIIDETNINLDHSNAYIQLPQTFHVTLSKKFEVFAGGYIGFLISPVATGSILFGGESAEKEHSFRQGLNFQYASDDEQTAFDLFNRPNPLNNILIRADGIDVSLKEFENSYDLFGFNIQDSKFLSIDYGLIFGTSYYLNNGLYLMGRAELGLRDITRNAADFTFTDVTSDQGPVFTNDVDKNFGLYLSLGFRF